MKTDRWEVWCKGDGVCFSGAEMLVSIVSICISYPPPNHEAKLCLTFPGAAGESTLFLVGLFLPFAIFYYVDSLLLLSFIGVWESRGIAVPFLT
jgi:hypothetical protein